LLHILGLPDQFHILESFEQFLELIAGQPGILHNYRPDVHVNGKIICATTSPSSSPKLKLARSPYNNFSLCSTFCSPSRVESPAIFRSPVFLTSIYRCPSLFSVVRTIRPPCFRLAIPCFTAFSTKIWMIMGGMPSSRVPAPTCFTYANRSSNWILERSI